MSELQPIVRCAVYTRKSTEEGLEREFNTLQAQREAAEAYILSQKQSGWHTLPDAYEDGGFGGASLERPALDNDPPGHLFTPTRAPAWFPCAQRPRSRRGERTTRPCKGSK